jgi:hypothetical protein
VTVPVGAPAGWSAPVRSFRGGMRYGTLHAANWTWPLVTLDIYPSGIELRPTCTWLPAFIPTRRFRYDDIAMVQLLRGFRNMRLISRDGAHIIFTCYEREELLGVLRMQGGVRVEGR